MSSNHKQEQNEVVRVELKYCERCGGLWLRESGAGVYCKRCQVRDAEMPVPKKKPGRATVPGGTQSRMPLRGSESAVRDAEAAGGVA